MTATTTTAAARTQVASILHSFRYSFDYLREQVGDVPAGADMVQQPNGIANHPAWVIGHLVHACQMLGGAIGVSPWLPHDWAKRYGTGSSPVAEVGVYETKEQLLASLRDAQLRLARAVAQLDDAQLDAAFPDPSLHDVFPTVRHALTQVLVAHAAFHVGQVSIWRRAMGLPRMQRSFE